MKQTIDFTKEERNDIAEFVYSEKADILIKSDAINLINVLHRHNIIKQPKYYIDSINNQKEGIVEELIKVLHSSITIDQMNATMKEYYGGH